MLEAVSQEELGRLKMSVGYGRQKKGRPLSPIEVGSLLRRAQSAGASLGECAKAIRLNGTGHIGRFLQLLKLPDDLQHLVDWGVSNTTIGFSTAVELSRFQVEADQRCVANAVLAQGLNTREVQQVRQLRERSRRSISECIQEIVGMRPRVEKRYVFIGSVGRSQTTCALSNLTQTTRDAIVGSVLKDLGLHNTTGRLGSQFFTLVGNGDFNHSLKRLGTEHLEGLIRTRISKALEHDHADC